MKHDDYTVGWICALAIETAVARAMLDERHDHLPQDRRDRNSYAFGRIGPHNVVIACLPEGVMGITSAARVAEQMSWTFRALRFGLMVGIGGGVPSPENDIRLGDVVVGRPTRSTGGVIQYDYGKTVANGMFEFMGSLNRPPDELLQAVLSLKAGHLMEEPVFPRYLLEIGSKYPRLRNAIIAPSSQDDRLFEAEYNHSVDEATCVRCNTDRLVGRPTRADRIPLVHYGLIASGNQVMKDGRTRERLGRKFNVLCFEMEAAGLMDTFPCLVIRGICDYADTHKNKQWQGYAAASAAAYAKELLSTISSHQLVDIRGLSEVTMRAVGSPTPNDYTTSRRDVNERTISQDPYSSPRASEETTQPQTPGGRGREGRPHCIDARENGLYTASNRYGSERYRSQSDHTEPRGNLPSLYNEGLAQDGANPMRSLRDERHAPDRIGSFHRLVASDPLEPLPLLPEHRKSETAEIKGNSGTVEKLDARYCMRVDAVKFFERGRVFSLLWHENAGGGGDAGDNRTHSELSGSIRIIGMIGGEIFSYIRRMVVVKEDRGFCLCLPITTYGGQGVNKMGLSKEDKLAHSVVHMTGTGPFCLPEEMEYLGKSPIAVAPAREGQNLDRMSRIDFRKVFAVKHNVKVINVGKVTTDCLPVLLGYLQQSLGDG